MTTTNFTPIQAFAGDEYDDAREARYAGTREQIDAQRELQELNALHLEQALIQARIDAALDRLSSDETLTLKAYSVDNKSAVLPGSRVHVLLEKWHRSEFRKEVHRAHLVEDCNAHWCHADGEPRSMPGEPEFTWAYRGEHVVAGWRDGDAILVRAEVTA